MDSSEPDPEPEPVSNNSSPNNDSFRSAASQLNEDNQPLELEEDEQDEREVGLHNNQHITTTTSSGLNGDHDQQEKDQFTILDEDQDSPRGGQEQEQDPIQDEDVDGDKENGDGDEGISNSRVETATDNNLPTDANITEAVNSPTAMTQETDENSDSEITIIGTKTIATAVSKKESKVIMATTNLEDLSTAMVELELDCVDEPLEQWQLEKAKSVRSSYDSILRQIASLKRQSRLVSGNKNGVQLIGTRPAAAAPASGGSLVRPPAQQPPPGRFVQQPQPVQQRPTINCSPRIISRTTAGQPIFNQQHQQHGQLIRTMAGQQGAGQLIRTTTANGANMQPLLFDASSGLLLMPAQGQVVQAVAGQPPGVTMTASMNGMRLSTIQPNLIPGQQVQIQPTGTRQPIRPSRYNAPVQRYSQRLPQPRISTPVRPARAIQQQQQPQPARPTTSIRPPTNQTIHGRVGMPMATSTTAKPTPQQQQDKKSDDSKTFPSLVVNVKPCLFDKASKAELQKSRGDLDSRVKSLLVYPPAKFTEWLMQRGLLRLEHRCAQHQSPTHEPISYKLGMYSDSNKQPFSGGYVWISECCPDKQISVFQGSIFEASVYPPGALFKLIYHWACQTSAQNVLLWVKVTSYYLKNFYTLLRSACVSALHEFSPEMGGPGKYIEVGIITLGTSMPSTGQQKQVKIEILGVFDPITKQIRLKVVNPQNNPGQNRVLQILWPLRHWVHKESTILIDGGIEKSLIIEMGFANVLQSKNGSGPKPGAPTNVNVMNYLKHVVPKMFQNTLCVLSKSLIQQFLDELCWRELWGQNAGTTFDNIINHLVQMTKWDTGEQLITRLNKISLNPFGEWSYNRHRSGIDLLPASITSDFTSAIEQLPRQPTIPNLGNLNGQPANKRKLEATPPPPAPNQHDQFNLILRTQPRTLFLHSYYYAESVPENIVPPSGLFPSNLKCPLCSKLFTCNLDVVKHVYAHVQSLGPRGRDSVCEYCLRDVSSLGTSLSTHVAETHKLTSAPFPCLICQEKFTNDRTLILHMWDNHCKEDMPYRCDLCNYKSSFHHDAADHFQREHKNYDSVQCPICLKVMSAKSFGCMKQVVVHLQSHTVRRGKKCPHCILTFVNELEYRGHLVEGAHQEVEEGVGYIVTNCQSTELDTKMPTPPPRATPHLPPPVKKSRQEEPSKSLNVYKPALRVADNGATQIEDFRSKCSLPVGLPNCLECGAGMNTAGHYPAFISCIKCRFSTSCRAAMDVHLKCHSAAAEAPTASQPVLKPGLKVKPSVEVKWKMSCSCGWETKNPVAMATHLVKCEKYTAVCEGVFGEEENFMDQIGLVKN